MLVQVFACLKLHFGHSLKLHVILCSFVSCPHLDKKLGELDSELKKIRMQRDSTQMGLKGKLKNNRDEQERLREKLRQLENEDADLSKKIDQNDRFQAEADQVLNNLVTVLHYNYE